MSGLTSQPCLGSIVEALRHTERDTGLDPEAIRQLSFYWEAVRAQYAAFESDLRAGRLGGLSPRDAGRPVHQPQGAGALARPRDALARGRPRLPRRQRPVRRHRQGDAVLQGRRRHGADDGGAGPDRRPTCSTRRARSRSRPRWSRCCTAISASRPAAGRQALQQKVLKGETPITVRPGSLLPDADLAAAARRGREALRPRSSTRTSSPPT